MTAPPKSLIGSFGEGPNIKTPPLTPLCAHHYCACPGICDASPLYREIFDIANKLGYGRSISVLNKELFSQEEYKPLIRHYQIDQPDGSEQLTPLIPRSEAELFAQTISAVAGIIGLPYALDLLAKTKRDEVPGPIYEVQRKFIPSFCGKQPLFTKTQAKALVTAIVPFFNCLCIYLNYHFFFSYQSQFHPWPISTQAFWQVLFVFAPMLMNYFFFFHLSPMRRLPKMRYRIGKSVLACIAMLAPLLAFAGFVAFLNRNSS